MKKLDFLVETAGKTKKQIISEVMDILKRKEIKTVKPDTCHLWNEEYTKEDKNISDDFEQLFTYIDDSHLIRRLLKCKDCGQLYFYEFYEEIDWVNGYDPQYRTWIPVRTKEDAKKLSVMQVIEILEFFPRLQSDWPAYAEKPKFKWFGK